MIKITGKDIAALMIIGWILLFGGIDVIRSLLAPAPQGRSSQPTPDIKAVLAYTPTPGAGGGSQIATAQALYLPTPRTVITIGDAKAFAAAMYSKAVTLPVTFRILAEWSGSGSAVFCKSIKLVDWQIDSFCAYAVVWAEWQAGLTEQAFQGAKIEITEGKSAAPVMENGIGVVRKTAIINVLIERWGLNGPIIRNDNQRLYTVKDASPILKANQAFREVATGDNVIEEVRGIANNSALYLARWDSLIGVWRTGGRIDYSAIESLRTTMEANLNSDKPQSYQIPKQQLLTIAQAQARQFGYDSVESIVIKVAPLKPGQVVYVTTMEDNTPAQLNFDAAVKRRNESSEQWNITQAELAAGGAK